MVLGINLGTGIVKDLIVGAVAGFVAGFIYEKSNILQGKLIDTPFGTIKAQTLIFIGISVAIAIIGLVKGNKQGMLITAIAFFISSYIVDTVV